MSSSISPDNDISRSIQEDILNNFLAPALQSANLSFWRWDLQTNIVASTYTINPFLNPQEDFYTISLDSFMSKVHPEERESLQQKIQYAIQSGEKCHAEFRYLDEARPTRWFAADCHVVNGESGKPRWVVGTRRDITEHKEAENTILKTAEAISATLGADYAHSLVASLAQLLNAYSVCIALFSADNPNIITSIARYTGGALRPSIVYFMEGSPFDAVLQKGFYVHPECLAEAYPSHEVVTQLNAESYIGVKLQASDGSTLGILHAAWQCPIPDVNLATSVFQFFAVRAGAEMERKQMEERLHQQARLLEQSERTARIGGWEFNLLTDTLFWTEETYRIHETDAKEYTPTPEAAIRFYTPEGVPLIIEAVHSAITQGKPYDLELQIVTAKGRRKWVRTQGRAQMDGGMVTKIYGAFQDITERQQGRQELLASQANLKAVLESLNDIVFSVDRDLNLITINTGAIEFIRNVFGTMPKPGDSLRELAPPEYISLWLEDYDRVFQGETFSVVRASDVSGQARIAEVHFNPIFTGGEVTGAVVRANNITERVRRQEELAQSQKLEALGQLSGGVAHDFNNFLQVIMGYTELLRSYVETTPSAAKYLEQILRASGQANALTTQLLAFARQQHIAPKVFDLNQHLQLNANMLLHLVGEHIEVITRWDVPVTKVKMDPSQVNQMMMNLVINARDAMPKGGKLTISTCKISAPSPEMGTPAGLKQGDYCRLQIADTGVGMSSETMNRIFEPLFTTKPVGKGTGFGLAICYGIVKQAEGVIHAESELGRGSTFSIYLPSCDETLSHSETPEREANLHRSSATILLVEDDVAVRDITANILEAHGYRPLVAHSPRHAIEIARDNDAIDLLLTDVVMPQLNGKQVSDAVTALRPQIKVLFMSGYALDVFDSQEIQLGGLNLLQKPFSPNQLAQAIRETLDSPA